MKRKKKLLPPSVELDDESLGQVTGGAMIVNHNMAAMNTLTQLNKNQNTLSKSLAKLSSGMKINSAADDPSGYQISERMRVQIRSLDQANYNAQNGRSMMKVAEGAVSSTVEVLRSLKEKAINAVNDTNTEVEREAIQKEINASVQQIDDNALLTFNGKVLSNDARTCKVSAVENAHTNDNGNAVQFAPKIGNADTQIAGITAGIADKNVQMKTAANSILDSFVEGISARNESGDNSVALQIGANANQRMNLSLDDMRESALGLSGKGAAVSVADKTAATAALNVIDNALQRALNQEASIGATMNRLEFTSNNLTTSSENLQSAESTYRDADMAKEMTEFTKNNILMQTATAMLSQANEQNQNVLSLLQ